MKQTKMFIGSLIVLILLAALYRLIPGRPAGFAPQIAIALFGGAIIKDKKWAFALPLFSMFISDVLYQVLYQLNMTDIYGFYDGQITNYLLFAGITVMGFFVRKENVMSVFSYSLIAPTAFFIVSNGLYWLMGGANAINIATNEPLVKNWNGLMTAYLQGLPFYRGTLSATVVFSTLLFGGYYLFTRSKQQPRNA
jgi:hypothetical protein